MSSGPGLGWFAVMLAAGTVAFVCQMLAFGAVVPLWWVSPLLVAFVVALVARHV